MVAGIAFKFLAGAREYRHDAAVMAKRAFSLQATGTVDLGSLKGINAFTSFMDAWTSKAADIPILGASGTKMREQHLRLRAEVVLPTVCSLGAGADSVDAIVSTVKHLARPAQVGEARMFGAAVRDEQRIHLVPQDASCAVCGSEDITLEHTGEGAAKRRAEDELVRLVLHDAVALRRSLEARGRLRGELRIRAADWVGIGVRVGVGVRVEVGVRAGVGVRVVVRVRVIGLG